MRVPRVRFDFLTQPRDVHRYSGVLTSPFFGTYTSVMAARKLEIGSRFYF